MRQKIVLLVSCSALAGVSLVFLYFFSRPDPAIKNGFERTLLEDPLALIYSIDLDHSNYNFSGWVGETLYLRSVQTPNELLEISNGKVNDHIVIHTEIASGLSVGELQIDSPFFYLADLKRYIIYRGLSSNWTLDEVIHPRDFFTEFISVSGPSLILRTFNKNKTEFRLTKEETDQPLLSGDGLLEKQIDGLFCTDGMLRFDKKTQSILYTYFYRNEFIRADTSLSLVFRARTIDTTRRARISVGMNAVEHYSTLSSPPFIVNRTSVCHNGVLYINSTLISDTEERQAFASSNAIDCYSITDGSYLISFYIPKIDGAKLRQLWFHKNRCYALLQNRLVVYQLTDHLFELLSIW